MITKASFSSLPRSHSDPSSSDGCVSLHCIGVWFYYVHIHVHVDVYAMGKEMRMTRNGFFFSGRSSQDEFRIELGGDEGQETAQKALRIERP